MFLEWITNPSQVLFQLSVTKKTQDCKSSEAGFYFNGFIEIL
jgi:hypothetical protein